jgi:hypothetical protein
MEKFEKIIVPLEGLEGHRKMACHAAKPNFLVRSTSSQF